MPSCTKSRSSRSNQLKLNRRSTQTELTVISLMTIRFKQNRLNLDWWKKLLCVKTRKRKSKARKKVSFRCSRQLNTNRPKFWIISKNRSMFRSRKAMIQSFTNAHAPNSNSKKLIWLDSATTWLHSWRLAMRRTRPERLVTTLKPTTRRPKPILKRYAPNSTPHLRVRQRKRIEPTYKSIRSRSFQL